jgi:hypothetical protein
VAPGPSAGPTPGRVQIKAAGETKPQAIAGWFLWGRAHLSDFEQGVQLAHE